LKWELEQAEEYEGRWIRLGEQPHKTESEEWKLTARIRKTEVDVLKLLLRKKKKGQP
jgi:hypothetical protein